LLAKRFAKAGNLVTRSVAGEVLIVPVSDRVGDLDAIYTLNEIGAAIWQMIDGHNCVSQIVDAITRQYQVDAEDAEKDVLDFLASLEAANLIRPLPESGGS
jgi:hypothetical protein